MPEVRVTAGNTKVAEAAATQQKRAKKVFILCVQGWWRLQGVWCNYGCKVYACVLHGSAMDFCVLGIGYLDSDN